MSEALLDNVRWYAGLQEQRRAGVAQAMELDRPHLGRLQELPEFPLAQVVRLERISEGVPAPLEVLPLLGEDEPEVAVALAVPELELGLVPAVLPKECDRLGAELDRARRLVLHRPDDRLRARLHELALNRQPPLDEVDVGPLEPAQLALARAAVEREGVEGGRLRPRRLRGGKEGLGLVRLPTVLEGVLPSGRRVGLAGDQLRDVPIDEALEDRGVERAVGDRMVLGERRRRSASSPWPASV